MSTYSDFETEKSRSKNLDTNESKSGSHESASLFPPVLNLTASTTQLKADPMQRQSMEEEEEVMMKKNPVQRQGMEEEEELMMKKNPMQRQSMEEEEELMMKKNPMQRQGMEEEEELMMKKNPVQRKSAPAIQRKEGLPEDVQGQMESSLGADFSDVNIYANSSQATDVGALAYTQGNDMHFAPGQYNPSSSSGQELIGHELTHVVQQREGRVQPTGSVNGMPLNDDKGLESEADRMGRMAAQKKKK